jgi:hypothetical protein
MDDQIEALLLKKLQNPLPIANIDAAVLKPARGFYQPLQIPGRITGWPEELGPKIIVNACNRVPLLVEVLHGFRTYQPATARDQNLHKSSPQPLSPTCASRKTHA